VPTAVYDCGGDAVKADNGMSVETVDVGTGAGGGVDGGAVAITDGRRRRKHGPPAWRGVGGCTRSPEEPGGRGGLDREGRGERA